MPEATPRLSLPYIQPSQAQKHVTHNEALGQLDAIVQLVVEGFGLVTPPPAPVSGKVYALGALPVGAWAGQGGRLALSADGAWAFVTPQDGWRAWGRDVAELRVLLQGNWEPATSLQNVAGLGVNTGSDAVNRLAVAAPATLFSHEGAGHQVKVNKAAAADTATLLFQSGFSGRAEMGLAGSDDFSIKVSANGSTFQEALRIGAADGTVTLGQVSLGSSLRFPAIPALSADANTLDSYAEGSWTPGFSASTTAPAGAAFTASGQYVKIGRFVICTFEMTFTSKGTGGAGNVQITGFPFAAGTNYTASIRHAGITFPGSGAPLGRLSGTALTMFASDSTDLLWSAAPNAFSLLGSISYIASA